MRTRITTLAVSVALLATAGLAGCANDGGTTSTEGNDDGSGPIKIGVIVPLSGPAGPNGQDVLDAIEAKAQLINEHGGIDGRQLEVLKEDDQSDPATGVSAANRLVDEGASVIMGGWNSPVTLAIQPVLSRAGILNITSIPQNASILGGADPHAVRMNAGNAAGAHAAAEYISKDLGARSVGTMVQNDAYGNDAGERVRTQLQERGVKVSAQEQFDYADTDFRVPLSNMARSGVDVMFSANAAESSGMPALADQFANSGMDAQHFAAVGTVSPKVIDLAGGKRIDGLISADLYLPDVAPFSDNDVNNEFVQAFEKKTGNPPDKYAALGAVSVGVWAQAVEKAGTTNREDVSSQIHGGQFTDTILGDVAFTDHGQLKSKIYAFTVKNGKISVDRKIKVPDEVWER